VWAYQEAETKPVSETQDFSESDILFHGERNKFIYLEDTHEKPTVIVGLEPTRAGQIGLAVLTPYPLKST
jgi:hypothetical protein